MRHDRHYVDELANRSVVAVGFMVPTAAIETNRQQPRTDLGDLSELTDSIRARGVLEPLLVRALEPGRYQLIAGERRLHAARAAGLYELPCIEIHASDAEAVELALVENLQRKDLSPFEEAEGYATLAETYDYTHEAIAAAVGKSRTSVSEALRLLSIPPAIRDLCRHADISATSVLLLIARAGSIEEMERLIQGVLEEKLDREALRTLAAHPEGHAEPARPDGSTTRPAFRPLQIRFKPEAGQRAIHLALSIREPNVTREDLIQTLESLLAQVREGRLDERLKAPVPPSTLPE